MYSQLQRLIQKLMDRDFAIFGKEKACIEHLISEFSNSVLCKHTSFNMCIIGCGVQYWYEDSQD